MAAPPPDQWIWSAQPTHKALVDKATWDAQPQRAGADHGNVRDPEMPTTRPGRRYRPRSRLWCKICRRRMRGATRTGPTRANPGARHPRSRFPFGSRHGGVRRQMAKPQPGPPPGHWVDRSAV